MAFGNNKIFNGLINIIQKIKIFWNSLTRKRKVFYFVSLFSVLCFLFVPIISSAGLGKALLDVVLNLLAALFLGIASFFGWLAAKLMIALVFFATWKHYTNNIHAVTEGWKISRDVCNMFFIFILLIISFSTIIGIESYSYKKWLSKIVIFAILINFSKMIVGLLIDVSQIVMLTFVSGFRDTTVNNFAKGLHLDQLTKKNVGDAETMPESTSALDGFVIAVLACIMMLVLNVVLVIMITMIVARILSLWVLAILSPFAFLFQASPVGAKYANEWWQSLSKNLISGPILAMFIYLAMATIHDSSDKGLSAENGAPREDGTGASASLNGGYSIQKTSMILDFIIVIALMIAAIRIAGSLGVMGSNFANNMSSKLQKAGSSALKFGMGGVVGAAAMAGRGARRATLGGLSTVTGGQKTQVGRFLKGWNQDMDQARDDKVREKRKQFMKKMGIGSRAQEQIYDSLRQPKMRRTASIVKGVGAGIASGAAAGALLGVPGAMLGGLIGAIVGSVKRARPTRTEQAAGAGAVPESIAGRELEKMARVGKDGRHHYISDSSTQFVDSATGQQSRKQFLLLQKLGGNNKKAQLARAGLLDSIGEPRLKTVPPPPPPPRAGATEEETTKYRNQVSERNQIIKDNYATMKEHENKLINLSQGLEAYRQAGGDMTHFQDIIKELNAVGGRTFRSSNLPQNPATPGVPAGYKFNRILQSHEYAPDVYAPIDYRKTGKGELSEQMGSTSINGFIREGESHRDRIGVDFRQIEDELKNIDPDFDVSAEGMHLDGKEAVSQVTSALNGVLDKELEDIDKQLNDGIANGTLDDQALTRLGQRQSDLVDAKNKLSSGDIESLNLVNSGIKSGMDDRGRTMIHEELHDAGMKNEAHTESLGNYIKDNNLYSLTSQLGDIAKQYDDSEDFDPAKIYEKLQEQGGTKDRVEESIEKEISQGDDKETDTGEVVKEGAGVKSRDEDEEGGDEDEEAKQKVELGKKSISKIETLGKSIETLNKTVGEDTTGRKLENIAEAPFKRLDRLNMIKNIRAVKENTETVENSTEESSYNAIPTKDESNDFTGELSSPSEFFTPKKSALNPLIERLDKLDK